MERERGSSLPLLVLGVVAVAGMVVLLGRIGAAAADRARATNAADAAALAGAAEGEPAARELARANGGRLTRFERRGLDARVTVEAGGAKAVGRARSTGSPAGTDVDGVVAGDGAKLGRAAGLAPAMRAALSRAGQLLGRPVAVAAVVAPGLAIDVRPDATESLAAIGVRAGLCRQSPDEHPNRFELCPPP